MKKITVFLLTMVFCFGISTSIFAVDGNEMVTPREKQLAMENKQVAEVIEKGQKVAREIVKEVLKEVVKEVVKEVIKSGLK
jgi:N-acetylglucosamine kinase-like BadF-type ATPase